MAEDKENKAPQEETPEQLKAKIAELEKASAEKIAELEKASAEKDQLLAEAHKSISEAENTPASGRPEFTHKGEKYVQVVPKSTVKRDGKTIAVTTETLKKDKSLVEALIKAGSGILVKASDLASKKKGE